MNLIPVISLLFVIKPLSGDGVGGEGAIRLLYSQRSDVMMNK